MKKLIEKENECKELIGIAVGVIKDHKNVLEYHLDGKEDRGLETWFQLEFIAKLKENNILVTHPKDGYDLEFENYTYLGKVELKANSTFHPCCAVDGLKKYGVPVLFFEGPKGKNKKHIPRYTDKEYTFKCFTDFVEGDRKIELRCKSLFLRYEIVQLKDKCIVGILDKSEEPDY